MKKAFTMIEMIVVVAILAILIAIITPALLYRHHSYGVTNAPIYVNH